MNFETFAFSEEGSFYMATIEPNNYLSLCAPAGTRIDFGIPTPTDDTGKITLFIVDSVTIPDGFKTDVMGDPGLFIKIDKMAFSVVGISSYPVKYMCIPVSETQSLQNIAYEINTSKNN